MYIAALFYFFVIVVFVPIKYLLTGVRDVYIALNINPLQCYEYLIPPNSILHYFFPFKNSYKNPHLFPRFIFFLIYYVCFVVGLIVTILSLAFANQYYDEPWVSNLKFVIYVICGIAVLEWPICLFTYKTIGNSTYRRWEGMDLNKQLSIQEKIKGYYKYFFLVEEGCFCIVGNDNKTKEKWYCGIYYEMPLVKERLEILKKLRIFSEKEMSFSVIYLKDLSERLGIAENNDDKNKLFLIKYKVNKENKCFVTSTLYFLSEIEEEITCKLKKKHKETVIEFSKPIEKERGKKRSKVSLLDEDLI